MSYINEALKKAQKDRDGRYERFGGIIADPAGPARPRRRRLVIGAAVVLPVLIAAGLLAVLYAPRPSSPVKKALPPPAPVAERAAASAPAAQPAAGEVSGPAYAAPAAREAQALYEEGLAAQRKGDLKGAEALYRKVLQLAPAHVQALNNTGVLYMGQNRREQAIAMFGRAIVLKKEYVDPYYNLACLYAQAGEIDEALWYLQVAMTINGDVKKWAEKDADMKNLVASPAFRKLMEGRKN